MFTGLARGIASFRATKFEKARLKATYTGDYDAPYESDLQVILYTLSGKDPEIRPQIAYTTILQKLESSQSKFRWCYLIKNLIILDRCVDERFFVQDIANLKISHVEQYNEQDLQFQQYAIDQFIRLYFRYIKFKAFVYSKKNTSFNMSREEVKSYLMSQEPEKIFDEFSVTQKLQDIIMEVGNTDKKGHLKFKLNQYVFLLLLFTLTNLFATQYMATLALVEKLFTMKKEHAQTFKSLYIRFLKQNEQLVVFINSHKYIKGYGEVNIIDFSKCDTRIISAIDDYLLYQSNQQQAFGLPEEIIFNDEESLVFNTVNNVRVSVVGFNEEPVLRSHIKKFDLLVQENKNPFLLGADYTAYEDFVWLSGKHNYSSDYHRIDQQFYKKSELAQAQKILLLEKFDLQVIKNNIGRSSNDNSFVSKSLQASPPQFVHAISTPAKIQLNAVLMSLTNRPIVTSQGVKQEPQSDNIVISQEVKQEPQNDNIVISQAVQQKPQNDNIVTSQGVQQGPQNDNVVTSQGVKQELTKNSPTGSAEYDFDKQVLDEDAFFDELDENQ